MAAPAAYRRLCEAFRWEVPEAFNFTLDVIERQLPGDPAVLWENAAGESGGMTYGGLAERARRLAGALARRGLAKGDRVVVMLPRIPEWPVAMAALLRLGAVPIPCIEMLTARDLDYRVRNSGARAVVCRGVQSGKLAGLEALLPLRVAVGGAPGWADFAALEAEAGEAPAPRVAAEDPAVMYYTSGSTGHPKGVLHAARALHAWRFSAKHWLDLRPGERIWCTADTGWSKAGTAILFGPWSMGAACFLYDGPFDPAERLRLLARHAITVYCAPATELARVADQPLDRATLPALRRTVSAGEAMNPAVAARWQEKTGIEVAEAYGQTETLMTVLNYPGVPVKPGSMGLPAPGLPAAVLDEENAPCPDGVEGQLAIRAPNPQLMLGYWQEPKRSAACIVENAEGRWFLTGDRVRRDEEGYLWYAGRADDVIGSAGYRIGPLEVENALLEHPAVLECAVVGWPDPERGEIVKAYVVPRPGHTPGPELAAALQAHVKSVTAPYKYPRAVRFVEALPKTQTGKIRRVALRQGELG